MASACENFGRLLLSPPERTRDCTLGSKTPDVMHLTHMPPCHMASVQSRLVVHCTSQHIRSRSADKLSRTPTLQSQSLNRLAGMHSCAQVQVVSSLPLSARSTSGQQGYQSVSRPAYASQLARRARSIGKASPCGTRRYTTTFSAAPFGEVALLPSLFPVVLRAFSAGLLVYSSVRWVSARADRKQASESCI